MKDYTCRLACQRSIVYGRGFALLRRMVRSFLTEFDVFIIRGKECRKKCLVIATFEKVFIVFIRNATLKLVDGGDEIISGQAN